MPAILLEHPQHGRHYVYDDADLAKHAAVGWQPVGAAPAPEGSSASVSSPEEPAAAPPVKRKPGRPRKVTT